MKIGRNDPCPCGSGIKYKKCHLDRAQQAELTEGEVRGYVSRHKIAKRCHYAAADGANCSGRIIDSHTVSKSSSLKKIARNSKVYHFEPNINALFDTGGKLRLKLVGVGDASTFPGFCAKHDKELFSPFEDNDFAVNAENCTLLGYRALSKELHAKQSSKALVPFMRSADKGKPEVVQAHLQTTVDFYSLGTDLALVDLLRFKADYEKAISSADYSDSKYLVVTFDETPHILFSGPIFPEFDFAGNQLQVLGTQEHLDGISVNAVATPSGGAVVFQWIGESKINEQLIRSLSNIPTDQLATAITQFAFESFENLFISPDWWDGLDKAQQDSLQARTMCGTPMKSHTKQCFIPGLTKIASWATPLIHTNAF